MVRHFQWETEQYLTWIEGVNSLARRVVLDDDDDSPPQRTGFSAYRAVVDTELVKGDPKVSWLLDRPSFNLW